MSLTLYHGEPNGPSLTVLAALFEKGIEAQLSYVDLAGAQRHALPCAQQPLVAMSIEGEGPVLVVDGEGLADSVFIACYLDDIGGGTALRPREPYARWEMMAWCRQLIERTAPAAAYLGCQQQRPHATSGAIERITSVDLRQRWEQASSGAFETDKLTDSRSKIAQAVAKIESRLAGREWLMGSFSIADLESYAWLAGMPEVVPDAFADKPRTQAWLERVRARPSVARALALSRSGQPARCWAPGPEINRWG